MSKNDIQTRELFLDAAAARVAKMWRDVSPHIKRAGPNDTIHFVHEEAGEVCKVAMHLGLIGEHTYTRSEETEAHKYTYANLVEEIGDVILMALTLAEAFDLNPSVCLAQSLRKFYARADAKKIGELREHCDEDQQPREYKIHEYPVMLYGGSHASHTSVPVQIRSGPVDILEGVPCPDAESLPHKDDVCKCGHDFDHHGFVCGALEDIDPGCRLCRCGQFSPDAEGI